MARHRIPAATALLLYCRCGSWTYISEVLTRPSGQRYKPKSIQYAVHKYVIERRRRLGDLTYRERMQYYHDKNKREGRERKIAEYFGLTRTQARKLIKKLDDRGARP